MHRVEDRLAAEVEERKIQVRGCFDVIQALDDLAPIKVDDCS